MQSGGRSCGDHAGNAIQGCRLAANRRITVDCVGIWQAPCSFCYAVVGLSLCFNANHSVYHLAFPTGEFWAESFQRSGQGFQVSSGRSWLFWGRFRRVSLEGFCGVPGKGSGRRFCAKEAARKCAMNLVSSILSRFWGHHLRLH